MVCIPSLKVSVQPLLSKSEECNIHIGMLRDRVSNTLRAVSDKLCRGRCTLTVDGLGIAALRVVGHLLGGREAKNVGPLFQLFGIYYEMN